MKNVNTSKKNDLSSEELAVIQKAVRTLKARRAYQKKRNARPDVAAKRRAYNRSRYRAYKASLVQAEGLGLLVKT